MADRNTGASPRRDRKRTEEALARTALSLMERDGVLAGTSLQEIADAAGLTRPLIHQYFGSRRGLLRAALRGHRSEYDELVQRIDAALRERRDEYEELVQAVGGRRAVSRALWTLRTIIRDRIYAHVATLLAIDGDDAFDPLPGLELYVELDRKRTEGQSLRSDHDPEGAHAVYMAMVCGLSVLREPFARRLGVSLEALDERCEAVVLRMLDGLFSEEPREGR